MQCRDPCSISVFWSGEFHGLYTDFSGGSASKASAYNMGGQVWSPGQKDLLEKEMATHSSILAWKIPWMENMVGYSPQGRRVGHNRTTSLFFMWFISDGSRIWNFQTLQTWPLHNTCQKTSARYFYDAVTCG